MRRRKADIKPISIQKSPRLNLAGIFYLKVLRFKKNFVILQIEAARAPSTGKTDITMKLKTILRTLRITVIAAILATATISFASAAKGWGAGESGTAGRQAGDKRLRIRDQDGKGSDNSHGKPSRADQDFHHSRPACQHRTAPQGTSQFTLPAHGVYIVKIGDVTCKVAI